MGVVKLITTLFIQLDFWDHVKDFVLSPFSNPKIERAITILVIPFFVNVSIDKEKQRPNNHTESNSD